METFLGSLAVLAITGLTVLAYREPRAFEFVYVVLGFALIVGAAWLLIWNTSNIEVWLAVGDYIPADDRDEARQAVNALRFDYRFLWAVPVGLGYLAFLHALPRLSGKRRHDEEDHDIDGKPK